MRFFANGPDIPDDLLLARDQGRVIFFCGAGVSRARANLPDFFGLAAKVTSALGVASDSAAQKLIQEAQQIDERIGISGLISADRVFGILERDFLPRDIEAAVAAALKPAPESDLSAHQTLLDLATTTSGKIQLVTTNFDRLFDDCKRGNLVWRQPKLPNLSRPDEMDGIVYLHGRANETYDSAEGDGFVLSSSEFGRAYLSDGWATSFVRSIIERFIVVFVGYAADDPPVQYLLEALNKATDKTGSAYAFQFGGDQDAASRWRHKGVRAIAYSDQDGHAALWQTLGAWAERARNPDLWYSNVVNKARGGPRPLLPHERGQVAHIVSTYEGVKKFSEGDSPPPAEWLCVFDPYRRYAKPGHIFHFFERGDYIDPFDLYGLDSDITPSRISPENYHAKRDTPSNAWDVFALNRLDRTTLGNDNFPSLRGHWSVNLPRTPPRLGQLGVWIQKVANQAAAPWWAAKQIGLHPDLKSQIHWQLFREAGSTNVQIRDAWRFLFEAWDNTKDHHNREWYELKELISKQGWDSSVARQYSECFRPRFEARSGSGSPIPPKDGPELRIDDLVRRDVTYANLSNNIEVPDAWLPTVVRLLRQNLEVAVALETELGGYGLTDISPITDANVGAGDRFERTFGLSAFVIFFAKLFKRLIGFDQVIAKHEFQSWLVSDKTVFARLRIWASSNLDLVTADEFGLLIASLDNDVFWSARHQRDLLISLAARWSQISPSIRSNIEERLLDGPRQWEVEEDESYEERSAFAKAARFEWLASQGCSFSTDVEQLLIDTATEFPRWNKSYAEHVADSLESRSGWVKTKTDHAPLLGMPLNELLSRAHELTGRTEDFLVENDPFSGFCKERPVRAFAAIVRSTNNEISKWAWGKFLSLEARKSDSAKFKMLIARDITSLPIDRIAALCRPTSNWLLEISKDIDADCAPTFDELFIRIVEALKENPDAGRSGIVRGDRDPDWTMEAINAPVGHLAQALLNDPRIKDLERGAGFPKPWLTHADALLSLGEELRRHASVIFFIQLNWFYAIDPAWTESKLLPALSGDESESRDAAWAGFFQGATVPRLELYSRLKPHLLKIASESLTSNHAYREILAGILLAGWGTTSSQTNERCISSEEMRNVLIASDDEFRRQILLQAQQWVEANEKSGSGSWPEMIPAFIKEAWPKQIVAKSPTISARLSELAFSSAAHFVEYVNLILPLLTPIERDQLYLPSLRRSEDNIIDLHPERALALLFAILPENARAWPYEIEKTIERIEKAAPTLVTDPRLVALKQRWDAR